MPGVELPDTWHVTTDIELSSPIAQIQKVVADGAIADLGDDGHHTLELVAADASDNFVHEGFIEASLDTFFGQVALVNEQVEQLVNLFVGEAEFVLVGLVRPQVGGRRLVDDRRGDVHVARKLADLRLVEVADGIEGGSHVTPNSRIAEQDFGFVARADHESFEVFGAVIQDDHASARHDVAFARLRHVGVFVDERIHHVGDLDRLALDSELVNQQLSMIQRVAAGCFVGHADDQHVLGSEGFGGEGAREGGVDAAREADDGAGESDAGDFGADETCQDLAGEGGIDGEVSHCDPSSHPRERR